MEILSDFNESVAAGRLSFRLACTQDLTDLVRMLADDPLGSKRETWSVPVAADYVDAFAAIDADPNNELVVGVIDEPHRRGACVFERAVAGRRRGNASVGD